MNGKDDVVATPVAFRWRYLRDGGPAPWVVRQSPIAPAPATQFCCAVEVEFLYSEAAVASLAAEIEQLRVDLEERTKERDEAFIAAADVARGWLEGWAHDLYGTFESYIEAKTTGKHSGRRITVETATLYARQFRERAEAVAGCADGVAEAIRARAALVPTSQQEG